MGIRFAGSSHFFFLVQAGLSGTQFSTKSVFGLKPQCFWSSVINELNFTELSDEMKELYVEREELPARFATVFLTSRI